MQVHLYKKYQCEDVWFYCIPEPVSWQIMTVFIQYLYFFCAFYLHETCLLLHDSDLFSSIFAIKVFTAQNQKARCRARRNH